MLCALLPPPCPHQPVINATNKHLPEHVNGRAYPGALFDLADLLARARVDDGEGLAVGCLVPFVVDEDLRVLDLDVGRVGIGGRHLKGAGSEKQRVHRAENNQKGGGVIASFA